MHANERVLLGLQSLREHDDANGGDGVQQSQVSSSEPGPSILASNVIGPLLLEALDGFLFMVSSSGEIEFVSENVTNYLHYSQNDLIGKSIYQFIHVDDQLEFSNCLAPLVERSLSGVCDRPLNRSNQFTCRLQAKRSDVTGDYGSVVRPQVPQYVTLQILAILQPYPQERDIRDQCIGSDIGNQYFLACIARRVNDMEQQSAAQSVEQFVTKQDLTGKILACDTSGFSIDQRTVSAFIGHDIKDFCHVNDSDKLLQHLSEVCHIGSNLSGVYRMQLAPGHYVFVQTKSKLFKNSASGHPEFIMSTHSIVRKCDKESELNGSASSSLMNAVMGKTLLNSKAARQEAMKSATESKRSGKSRSSSSSGTQHRGGATTTSSSANSCSLSSAAAFTFDAIGPGDFQLNSMVGAADQSEINDLLESLQSHEGSALMSDLSDLPFDSLDSFNFSFGGGGSSGSGLGQARDGTEDLLGLQSNDAALSNNATSQAGGFTGALSCLRGDLTDDAVTSLLTSLLPVRRQQRQRQSRAGSSRSSLMTPGNSSLMAGNSSSLSLQASRSATTALHLQLSPPPTKGIQLVSPVSSSSSSRFTTPSPAPLSSPLSSSTSPRYLPQSVLSGDGARPLPLFEHIRRLRNGAGGVRHHPALPVADLSASATTSVPSLANVGLKDLLLSNDEDETVTPTLASQHSVCSDISPAGSCGATTPHDGSATGHGGDATEPLFDKGKIFMSEAGDRPDSSTTKQRSKPAVLLMQLLSRPDDEPDDDDDDMVHGGSTGSSSNDTCNSNNDTSATTASPPPTSGEAGTASQAGSCTTPQSADKLMDSVFDNQDAAASIQAPSSEDGTSEQPTRNNLLRQLLNEEHKEAGSSGACKMKLLQRLMNSSDFASSLATSTETKSPTAAVVAESSQQSPDETSMTSCVVSQSSKTSSQLDAASYRSRLMSATSHGRHDELKEFLAKCWERNGDSCCEPPTSSSVATTAGVKRKASTVLETPADSTEDVLTSSSTQTRPKTSTTSKVTKNNILLASLLATRASAEQLVVNTLSIGSMATHTPQINLVKKTPSDQLSASFISDVGATSAAGSVMRRFSNSSVSSVTSVVSTAADETPVQRPSRLNHRSYSQPGGRGLNPLLTEAANLPYQEVAAAKNDFAIATSQESWSLAPADVMESTATSSALSLMDDPVFISQLEQFISSPGGMSELENLLGESYYSELTSSLFSSEQAPGVASESPSLKMEPQQTQQQQQQQQQMSGSRMRGGGSFGHQMLDAATGRSSGGPVIADDSSSAFAGEMLAPPQRPSSLAVSSAYFHHAGSSAPSVGSVPVSHLANVEALVQRAAAEAATRCAGGSAATSANGGGQMMDQHCGCIDRRLPSGVLPRGAPPSYAASTATMDRQYDISAVPNLNELLDINFPPNISVRRNQTYAPMASSSSQQIANGPGVKLATPGSLPASPFSLTHQVARPLLSPLTSPPVQQQQQVLSLQQPITGAVHHQSDSSRWTPRYTSAIMAGGDIVQSNQPMASSEDSTPSLNGFDMASVRPSLAQSISARSRSTSHNNNNNLQSPSFTPATELSSPRSVTSSRGSSYGLPSPFSSMAAASACLPLTGTSMKPPSSADSNPSPSIASAAAAGLVAGATQPHLSPMPSSAGKDEFSGYPPKQPTSGESLRGVLTTTSRGSCSLEVMQSLRAKCRARSLSSQQNVVVMSETQQPTANTPTMDSNTPLDPGASELPPDILQSWSELTQSQVDPAPSVPAPTSTGSVFPVSDMSTLLPGVTDQDPGCLEDILSDMPSWDLDFPTADLPPPAPAPPPPPPQARLEVETVERPLPMVYGGNKMMVNSKQPGPLDQQYQLMPGPGVAPSWPQPSSQMAAQHIRGVLPTPGSTGPRTHPMYVHQQQSGLSSVDMQQQHNHILPPSQQQLPRAGVRQAMVSYGGMPACQQGAPPPQYLQHRPPPPSPSMMNPSNHHHHHHQHHHAVPPQAMRTNLSPPGGGLQSPVHHSMMVPPMSNQLHNLQAMVNNQTSMMQRSGGHVGGMTSPMTPPGAAGNDSALMHGGKVHQRSGAGRVMHGGGGRHGGMMNDARMYHQSSSLTSEYLTPQQPNVMRHSQDGSMVVPRPPPPGGGFHSHTQQSLQHQHNGMLHGGPTGPSPGPMMGPANHAGGSMMQAPQNHFPGGGRSHNTTPAMGATGMSPVHRGMMQQHPSSAVGTNHLRGPPMGPTPGQQMMVRQQQLVQMQQMHAERATPVLQQQSQQMQSMSSDKNNAGLASFQWMSAPGGTTNNMMTQQQLPAPELQAAGHSGGQNNINSSAAAFSAADMDSLSSFLSDPFLTQVADDAFCAPQQPMIQQQTSTAEGKQTSGTRLSHVPSQQAASGESSTNTVGPPYSVTGEPPSIGQQHGSTLSGPVASGWTTPGSGSSLVAGSAEFSSSVAVSVSLLSSSQSPSVGFNSLQNVAPLLSGSGLSSQVPPATAPFTGYPDGGSSQSQSSAQNNTNPLPASLAVSGTEQQRALKASAATSNSRSLLQQLLSD